MPNLIISAFGKPGAVFISKFAEDRRKRVRHRWRNHRKKSVVEKRRTDEERVFAEF